MNLPRQIEAARVAREREGDRLREQMEALRALDLALITEGRLDLEIAHILRAREILPTLTEAQQRTLRAQEYDGSLVRRGICTPINNGGGNLTPLGMIAHALICGHPIATPILQRIAQHAIDAHCTARAAAPIPDKVSVYDRDDLEKYLHRDHRPINELRILASRLLPSEALTLLLSLLPPENA